MHELTATQWIIFGIMGLCVGAFTAGASYIINELMFRRRTARWDHELNAPFAPTDIVDKDNEGGDA